MLPAKSIIEIGHPDFHLRRWQLSDARSLARYANSRKIWRNVRDTFPSPYTIEHAEEWIEAASQCDLLYAIANDVEAVGGIGLHPQPDVYRMSAEIGFWLGEPFWNKGIMTKAVIALTDVGFGHYRLVRVSAQVFGWNPASARVLEKAGYEQEGILRKAVFKDGRFTDCLLFGKTAPAGEPRAPGSRLPDNS